MRLRLVYRHFRRLRAVSRLKTLAVFALMSLLATTAAARPGVVPDEIVATAAANGSVRVIVGLDVPFRPEGEQPLRAAVAAQRGAIDAAQGRVTTALGATQHRVTQRFASIPFIALEASPAALAVLGAEDLVISIQRDVAERPVLAQSGPIVEANAAWSAGFDGAGQVVAVLDTGADPSHPMLAGKVITSAEACFSDGRDCPNGTKTQLGGGAAIPCSYNPDECAHGTHVSGIAVGDGPTLDGVARGAQLIPIQVFSRFNGPQTCGFGNSPCAASYVSDQIAGLEHVLAMSATHSIASANMSLGGGTYSSPCDASEAARKAAIDNLRSVGIATVIASGNDGDANGIGTPACISTAISVGSTNDADVVSSFSNSDTFLSLLAPGQSIQSAVPGGGYETWNGTSMATPHVAGAWAVLKQFSPSASVPDILAALQASGAPVTDARNGVTKSRIRILSASTLLACPTGDADGDGVCDSSDVCAGFDDLVDSDLDTTPDGCDACPNDALDDEDADGVCGDLDVCAGFDDLVDSDLDTTPDGCDACPNDALNDEDADGVCGDLDVCAGFDDLVDSDLDTTPDGCDACPNDALNDEDADGVCGDLDVCAGFDDLVDSDLDTTPDGCDACPNDALDDEDADGVCGDLDVCAGFDDLVDSDLDAIPDGCDACPNDALNDADADGVCGDLDVCAGFDDLVDSDLDTTPDGCDPDDDGDGYSDEFELAAGTDPKDPDSHPFPQGVPALSAAGRALIALGLLWVGRALGRRYSPRPE